MRALLQFAVASGRARVGKYHGARVGSSSSQGSLDEISSPRSLLEDDGGWTIRRASTRFLTLIIGEAIAYFEKSGESTQIVSNDASPITGKSSGGYERPSLRESVSWAMWVVATVLNLESTYDTTGWRSGGFSSKKGLSATGKPPMVGTAIKAVANNSIDDHNVALGVALASARSPRAFATILLSTSRMDLDTAARCSAYYLCADMLHLSPSSHKELCGDPEKGQESEVVEIEHSSKATMTVISPQAGCCSLAQREYALPSQERALAGDFAVQLRSEDNSRTLASPLLQSKLELLAQWQRRRQAQGWEFEGEIKWKQRVPDDVWRRSEYQEYVDHPYWFEVTDSFGREHTDRWDLATPAVAGPGGGGDGFDPMRSTNNRTVGPGRPGTTESEASALSNFPSPCTPVRPDVDRSIRVLVETATASSVTLSWGGWLEDDARRSTLTGDIDGYGFTCSTSSAQRSEASNVAQALRSKTRHASTRRDQRLGLVLKVRDDTMFGWWHYNPPQKEAGVIKLLT